jgi:cellulose synthase/poly-beta-1,6-N-acetylglucosamine synthase-like glycosyltransferase
MMETFLWLSICMVGYAYVGYPLLISVLSRLFGKEPSAPLVDDAGLPAMTLLIAAFNEESVIADRIRNALASDYPAEKLRIVIASDGSSDRTVEIARSFVSHGVEVRGYSTRRGKPAVLNSTVPETHGDVIAFSDANTTFERDSLRNLGRWFLDPNVATVCGRLVLIDGTSGRNVDGLYWRYETFLKRCEARLGALLGANGGIYAMRRSAFVEVPANTVVEDFVMPLLSRLKCGGRIVYDNDAVAAEYTPPNIDSEFHRRARIGIGGFQTLPLLWPLLSPLQGWLALSFFSHKVLRWLCPLALVTALVTNAALLHNTVYRVSFSVQAAFYLLSAVGAFLPATNLPRKLARVATMFVAMNAALLVGFTRWMTTKQSGVWRRTTRDVDSLKQSI